MRPLQFSLSFIFILASLVEESASKVSNGARIIGGEAALPGQFPFVAAIYVTTSNSQFFCSGTIYNYYWIITAGTCVYDAASFTIQLGSNTLQDEDTRRLTFTSTEYVIHPDYNPQTLEHDIGLIKAPEFIIFSQFILPLSLKDVEVVGGTTVLSVGWGQIGDSNSDLSDNLQYVNTTIWSMGECTTIYGSQIVGNLMCVRGNTNQGTCVGDNGGPLVEWVDETYYYVVGVASFISGNGCESSEPSGYTRTYPYADWINDITKIEF